MAVVMAVVMAQRHNLSKPYLSFLSTDTVHLRPVFEYEIQNIEPTADVMYTGWEPLHASQIRLSPLKNYLNMFVDLFLLSKGESMLYIKSGFSLEMIVGNAPTHECSLMPARHSHHLQAHHPREQLQLFRHIVLGQYCLAPD
ncbi:hypothetical protein BWQ96_05140 [Gracilariopsis chorda]|uniref:Uncharacterized protein n=1 Tax=Gracilariopsis chorda TaxID=448386 RepID=A0A2V3ISK7_9FLOR|nr:hypothetical protein BWQ96_05140 [Gracilariopsis chorda]|eukprot:PXF45101.1 hypothetical protein BWQ96_05140 [Gracilariopsis chorda]